MERDNSTDRQLKEMMERVVYIKHLKSVLLSKEPESDQALQLIIIKLHHWLEDLFDRILLCYICPQSPDSETINSLPANLDPTEVCKHLISNSNFYSKAELICEVFMLSESTRKRIKALNNIRNGIAHRYKTNHKYFQYKKKNILEDLNVLEMFIKDTIVAIEEVLDIDELIEQYFEYDEGGTNGD
jgi:hypothetical protein